MAVRRPVDRRNLSDEERLILKALKLYYEHHLTQAEIAVRMGFSRPKVSRLLSEGRDRGLVKIEIAEPAEDFASLELALEEKFGLSEAVVVSTGDTRAATEAAAGGAGVDLLSRLCSRDTVLGLSWGVSLRALADATARRAFACKKVVPLVGGMGKAKASLHSNQVCASVAEKLGVECLRLDAPAIARSKQSREEIAALPGIGDVLSESAACDVAVVGIGGILPDSTLVQAGYFSLEEFLGFAEKGVVGDVCCHFLDATGAPRCEEISERIVGISLEALHTVPNTVGVATGSEKASGVAAVLRGGYVNTLVCDEDLARIMLEASPPEQAGEERPVSSKLSTNRREGSAR